MLLCNWEDTNQRAAPNNKKDKNKNIARFNVEHFSHVKIKHNATRVLDLMSSISSNQTILTIKLQIIPSCFNSMQIKNLDQHQVHFYLIQTKLLNHT